MALSDLWFRWTYKTTGSDYEAAAPVQLRNLPGWLALVEVVVAPNVAGSVFVLLYDQVAAPVAGNRADHSYGPVTPGATGGNLVREYQEISGFPTQAGSFNGIPFDNAIWIALSSTPRVYTAVAANSYSVFARGTLPVT